MHLILLSVLLLGACISGENPKEEEGVLVLNKDNFDTTLSSQKFLLVMFYAPWCGHCKSMKPKFEKAAQVLAAKKLNGILAKVDATVETEIAARYKINGYPTIKFFKDGVEEAEYDRDRSTEAFVEFVEQKADPNYKPPPKAVVTLSGANFSAFKESHDYFLLEFFAPWCGHCKSLAPEYEKAAKQLAKEDPPIHLAAVDATEAPDLAKQFDVTGYPTLKLMRKGKALKYDGPRDAEGIVNYMLTNSKDAAVPVASLSEFNKLAPEKRPVVIGYFPDENNALRTSFIEATNEVRNDYVVLLAANTKIADHFGLRQHVFAIVQPELLRSKFETGITIYDKTDATAEEVKSFLKKNSMPLVGHYTGDTRAFYDDASKERTFCLVFYTVDFSFDHRAATQMWRGKIAQIANGFKDRVLFAVADDEKENEMLQQFGLGETGADMNIGCKTTEGSKFAMPEMDEFDSNHITEFVKSVLEGRATPYMKSDPVPKKQTGPVKVVVAKSFAQEVTESPNDVLIEFYAPWCGHCKNLEPVYAGLAKRLQHIETLTLAKMDAVANDVPPGYKVEGFPTLYFKPSGSKTAVKLEGGHTEEQLMAHILKHAVASAPALKQAEKKKKDEL